MGQLNLGGLNVLSRRRGFHYGMVLSASVLLALVSHQANAQTLTTLCSFNGNNGTSPYAGLTLIGNTLYGTTEYGGANNLGTVFSVPVSGGSPTVLASFNNGINAMGPVAGLTLSGNTLYGTAGGGAYGDGTVFSVPVSGGNPTVLASFNGSNGYWPQAGLTLIGNTLYGTTNYGGANNDGTVFSVPISGGNPTVLASFNGSNGQNPQAGLTLSSDGNTLYGTTESGGANNDGTVFSVPVSGGNPTVLASFSDSNGNGPRAGLTLSGNTLYGTTWGGGALGDGTVFSVPVSGGNPTVLASFNNGSNGTNPNAGLTLIGNTLFGTTEYGGAKNQGTVFSVPISGGNPTVLASFSGSNGVDPKAGLTLSGNTLYGTTFYGGDNASGTVFAWNLIPATVSLSLGTNATIITGGTGSLGTTVTNSAASGANNLNYTLTATVLSGSATLGSITSGTGSLAPSASQSSTVSATSITLGYNTISLTATDPNSSNGLLSTTATLTVLGHAAPALSISTGNNQTVIVGATGITAGVNLSNGTLNQTGLAALDVNSLGALVTGSTGGKLVSSGSSQPYTATLSTGTLGTQVETFSLNVGDDHTLSGASAPINISTSATLTVLGHSNPALSIGSGNNQTIITGGTLTTVTLKLTDVGTNLSPLDVNTLGNLTGSTGTAVVASGGTANYTATGFNTTTVGLNKTLPVSLYAGDEQALSGHNALTLNSTSVAYSVLGHSSPALTVSSGNNQTIIVGATGITAGVNLSNGTANQSGLASLDVNSLGALVTGSTGGKLVVSGSNQPYTASLSTGTLGTQVETFSLNVGDDHTLSGATAPLNLSTSATLTVLGHAAPNLSISSGNNQTVIVGASGITAGLKLSDGTLNQSGLASLDVNSLGVLVTGSTGGKLIASGSAQPYTATLSTGTLGTQVETFSLNVGDDHTLPGASAATNISTSATLTILGHTAPALSVSTGNNQTVIVGATGVTAGLSLTNGTLNQSGLASLDVNSLGALITGSTGGKLVASGSTQPYTASLSTGTVGTQVETFSLNVGDDHTLPGASAATNVSTSATLTVLGHSNPALGIASGDNQTIITGGTLASVTLSLSNGTLNQTGLASLDVNSLGLNLTGSTGGKVVASGYTQPYTAALTTGTLGPQSQAFSMNVGDDHTLAGASSPIGLSTTAALTVLDHSNASLSSGSNQTSQTINFGNVLKGATIPSQSFTIYNRAANTSAQYTANLKLIGNTAPTGDSAFSTTLLSFGGLSAGGYIPYTAAINTTNYTSTGVSTVVLSGSQLVDDSSLPGAGISNTGPIAITLEGNVGNATANASNSQTAFGPALTAPIAVNGSYASLESTVKSTTGSGGYGMVGSTATILAGMNGSSGLAQTVSMQWRTQTQAERTGPGLLSDVLDLSGMTFSGSQTSPFVLQMDYDADLLPGGVSSENFLASEGSLVLGWFDPSTSQWENAIVGNIGSSNNHFVGVGAWNGDTIVGDWGINTASGTVWAVVNHNSDFAIEVTPTPEPSTLSLIAAAGVVGLAGYVWRRRKKIARESSCQDEADAPAILSFPSYRAEAKRKAA